MNLSDDDLGALRAVADPGFAKGMAIAVENARQALRLGKTLTNEELGKLHGYAATLACLADLLNEAVEEIGR